MKKLLLLEDNADRIKDFRSAAEELGPDWQLILWQDAPSMLANCEQHFEDVRLISLDHDLIRSPARPAIPAQDATLRNFSRVIFRCVPSSFT